MPPPGGPLIGSGMKQMIAEAAAAADMEHRDFQNHGGGLFKTIVMAGAGEYIDAWQIEVRDGSVVIDQIMDQGTTLSGDEPTASDYAYLQTDVFDYWRGAIDDAFRYWEDLPESSGLGSDLTYVLSGASEIQLAAKQNEDTGGYQDGNARLSSDVDNLFGRTGDLNGRYAYEFNTRYVSKIRPNINALHALTMVLAYGLGGEEELLQRSREQVADVAWKAKAAFEASGPKSGGDSTGLVVALIVVGAVAAGVAAVASGGTSVPATVAVVSGLTAAGAGGASDLIGALSSTPPAPAEIPLGGGHPDEVLTKLLDALADINQAIRNEENVLDELLTTTFEESRGVGSFDIDRPGIVDGRGSQVLENEQNVTVNPQVIADITHLWIPTISDELRACAGKLTTDSAPWTRPDPIGIGPTGPYSAYASLQFQVSVLLHSTAGELDGAAQALERAAAIIGLSDEAANRSASAIARRIIDENINT